MSESTGSTSQQVRKLQGVLSRSAHTITMKSTGERAEGRVESSNTNISFTTALYPNSVSLQCDSTVSPSSRKVGVRANWAALIAGIMSKEVPPTLTGASNGMLKTSVCSSARVYNGISECIIISMNNWRPLTNAFTIGVWK